MEKKSGVEETLGWCYVPEECWDYDYCADNLTKLLTGKIVYYKEWTNKKEHMDIVVRVHNRGGIICLELDNGVVIEPEWATLQYEGKIKRVYSEVDPYGEETWD